MSQEYPKMLFHIVEPAAVVNNLQEEEKMLSRGWSKSAVEFDEFNLLKAKIAHYEEALLDLYDKLEMMKQKLGVAEEVEKRKPGRPKKEV